MVARQNLSGKNQMRSRWSGSVAGSEFAIIVSPHNVGYDKNSELRRLALGQRLLNYDYVPRLSDCKPRTEQVSAVHFFQSVCIQPTLSKFKKLQEAENSENGFRASGKTFSECPYGVWTSETLIGNDYYLRGYVLHWGISNDNGKRGVLLPTAAPCYLFKRKIVSRRSFLKR